VAFGEASRADCLDYIEQNWPDIRPKSLLRRLGGTDQSLVAGAEIQAARKRLENRA
jgi:hypothetical protein